MHFAPANGFPSGTYDKLLSFLKSDYSVISIDKVGHNPNYPVDDNWSNLTKELINYIEGNSSEPVIGVGHSLGSTLTFMAAYNRPDLFKQIIMLDPPLVYGLPALMFSVAKKTGLTNRMKLVTLTRKRRVHWASREEAEAYYKKKKPFDRFDPECLRDYIQFGTVSDQTGASLAFDSRVESDIFRTTPHNMSSFKKKLVVPGAMVIGEKTDMPTRFMVNGFLKKHDLHFMQFKDGGHLFPLEYPYKTALLIREIIDNPYDDQRTKP